MRVAGTSLKQFALRKLVRQAHHPRGIVGWAVGWLFAHRPSNRQRNIWAVSLLDVQPTDRVLEIGFGPGIGIDHSQAMVRQAARRNAAAVRAHRVHLTHASVEQLPSFGDPLDAILAVNSAGFWPDPVERLRELRRLLRPAGRIALVSQPRCPGATPDTTARAAQELQAMLTQAGFTHPWVETLELDPPVACVLASNLGREHPDDLFGGGDRLIGPMH